MKKNFFVTLAVLLTLSICSSGQSSRFVGRWQGKINIGGTQLSVVFNISKQENGSLSSTSDSPDQGVFGMESDATVATDNRLRIEINKLGAVFTGDLVNDTTINGNLTQGVAIPLILYKTGKPVEKKRPQTPRPPFPYESYDVEYDNADKTVHFGATLTVPKPDPNIRYIKAPEYPVALLITGSGQQDRDETIMGHKPFAVLADHLTSQGYAVLRVDDRGTGKTTGDLKNATSADFAKDVEAGIEFLKKRNEIDKNKIGLIGHSEGGMIAPIVASHRKDINFIVLLAGPGVRIIDLMAEQNEAIARSTGISDSALNEVKPFFTRTVNTILKETDTTLALLKVSEVTENWAKRQSMSVLQELNLSTPRERDEYLIAMVNQLQSPWFRYFIKFNPKQYIEQLQCKVLALNGDKDIQVISSQNLPGIERALKQSKTRIYEIRELKGLNHLFQHCKECTVEEYAILEETFSPEALQIISDWLNKNVK